MAPYRAAGRGNRSGRTQADNDIFEGLPVKQWTHASTRVSLNPPASEVQGQQGADIWAEPPMPRDWQMLQPWTQQLLKLARSGKLGQKRKATRDADDADGEDYGAREDDVNGADDSNGLSKGSMLGEDRAFLAKKWRHVPDHALVPEHLHLEFLARSRKGMPSFYHNLNSDGYASIPTRKTKVSRVIDAATGEVAVYEIIVPEGQALDNEVLEGSEYANKEPVVLTVGTFIEGLGTANIEGVLVAEVKHAIAVAQRRNRPPPKKKGGPGRGKKRVTFTNPDGSTYTTIVPNATKIVPQPGQTVKHVAKGEEAARDITAEEAASMKAAEIEHEAEGDGEDDGDDNDDDDDEGEEDGDDNDDREDGELVEENTEIDHEADTKPSTPPAVQEPTPAPETNGHDVAVETMENPAAPLKAFHVNDESPQEDPAQPIESTQVETTQIEDAVMTDAEPVLAIPEADGPVDEPEPVEVVTPEIVEPEPQPLADQPEPQPEPEVSAVIEEALPADLPTLTPSVSDITPTDEPVQ